MHDSRVCWWLCGRVLGARARGQWFEHNLPCCFHEEAPKNILRKPLTGIEKPQTYRKPNFQT